MFQPFESTARLNVLKEPGHIIPIQPFITSNQLSMSGYKQQIFQSHRWSGYGFGLMFSMSMTIRVSYTPETQLPKVDRSSTLGTLVSRGGIKCWEEIPWIATLFHLNQERLRDQD